jgi:hypothetical protein
MISSFYVNQALCIINFQNGDCTIHTPICLCGLVRSYTVQNIPSLRAVLVLVGAVLVRVLFRYFQ